MQNVRIFFEKKELAKYISHLDLMRCFNRAMKRASIPIWYTEGFNPHPFMTFAAPLSLGTESYCESVDIRITDEISFDELKQRLNNALPNGINIIKVFYPVLKAEDIAFAQYEISLLTLKNEKLKNEIQTKLESDEILAEKKAKQGRKKIMKQINLKENISSFKIIALNDKVVITIVLTAGNRNNINPSLLIDAVTRDFAIEFEVDSIIKQKIFSQDMSEFE